MLTATVARALCLLPTASAVYKCRPHVQCTRAFLPAAEILVPSRICQRQRLARHLQPYPEQATADAYRCRGTATCATSEQALPDAYRYRSTAACRRGGPTSYNFCYNYCLSKIRQRWKQCVLQRRHGSTVCVLTTKTRHLDRLGQLSEALCASVLRSRSNSSSWPHRSRRRLSAVAQQRWKHTCVDA